MALCDRWRQGGVERIPQVRVAAEAALGQLDEAGEATKVVKKLPGASKRADEGTRCPFLSEIPFSL